MTDSKDAIIAALRERLAAMPMETDYCGFCDAPTTDGRSLCPRCEAVARRT